MGEGEGGVSHQSLTNISPISQAKRTTTTKTGEALTNDHVEALVKEMGDLEKMVENECRGKQYQKEASKVAAASKAEKFGHLPETDTHNIA